LISAQLTGGLGNQLFQIAAALALAYRSQDRAGFDFGRHQPSTQGESAQKYRNTIFTRLTELNWQEPEYEFFEQNKGRYAPIPYRPGIVLRGYFHGLEYFKDCQPLIRSTFQLSGELRALLREKYGLENRPSCSIHVRRGDYRGNPYNLRLLPEGYYLGAVALLPQDTVFAICSDDLEYCRRVFQGDRFKFSAETSDFDDFCLLAACDRQIVANSTFSWWASYLSDSAFAAIAPQEWLTGQFPHQLLSIQQGEHLQLIVG
jgi:hypothetical protein